MPFTATQMDLDTIILSEVSQREKDKHHVISNSLSLTTLSKIVSILSLLPCFDFSISLLLFAHSLIPI